MGMIAFRDIQSIAETRDGDSPVTHLRFSKAEALDVVAACRRLSSDSRSDLLSQPEGNVIFLARAVLNQPKTAYPVLKANYAMLLREEARKKTETKKKRNDAAKTHLRSFVFSALEKQGLAISRSGIQIAKLENGNMSVKAPIKAGKSFTAIQRAKAYIANCYKLVGKVEMVGGDKGEKLSLMFVVESAKGSNVFDKLTTKASA